MELNENFFEINLVEENLKSINLYMEPLSLWARGGREMIMISLVIDNKYKNALFFNFLKDIANKFNAIQNIYKGFYLEEIEHQNDPEVQFKYQEIKNILRDSYNIIKKYLRQTKKKISTKNKRVKQFSSSY